MKDLSRKSAKLILDILESVQKESKVLLKQCQSDKNCNLETYENIVDKCKELEYTIEEIKELL
jgi:predicted transcriptional regulator